MLALEMVTLPLSTFSLHRQSGSHLLTLHSVVVSTGSVSQPMMLRSFR